MIIFTFVNIFMTLLPESVEVWFDFGSSGKKNKRKIIFDIV